VGGGGPAIEAVADAVASPEGFGASVLPSRWCGRPLTAAARVDGLGAADGGASGAVEGAPVSGGRGRREGASDRMITGTSTLAESI
jgi:hypothetical protein